MAEYVSAAGLFDLPPSERLGYYEKLSAEARDLADKIKVEEFKVAYLRIAAHWRELAGREMRA
jgi:hypothetical protein